MPIIHEHMSAFDVFIIQGEGGGGRGVAGRRPANYFNDSLVDPVYTSVASFDHDNDVKDYCSVDNSVPFCDPYEPIMSNRNSYGVAKVRIIISIHACFDKILIIY